MKIPVKKQLYFKLTLFMLLAASCLLMQVTPANATLGTEKWQKTFNTSYNTFYFGGFETVNFLSDGTILASGHGNGALSVRYNADTGEVLDTPPEWIRYDTGNDYFYDQIIDTIGDIYLTGRKHNFDPAVWKYNAAGVLQAGWPKIYNQAGDGRNLGMAMDSSGYIISAGYNNSDWHISKYNKTTGDSVPGFPINLDFNGLEDKANKVATDSQDNLVVVGSIGVNASNQYDWHIRKYASDGTLLWSTTYDYLGHTEDPIDVAVDSEDNIIVCGYRNKGTDEGAGMDRDWYIVKYAKDGNGSGGATVLWEQAWNSGSGTTSRVARALLVDSRDNIYVAGDEYDNNNAPRSLIQYRDGATGALLKSQELSHPVTVRGAAGTAGTEHDWITDLALQDNKLIIAGLVWEGYLNYGRTGFVTMLELLPEIAAEDWGKMYYRPDPHYAAHIEKVGFMNDGNILAIGNHPWGRGVAVRYDEDGNVIDTPAEWFNVPIVGVTVQFHGLDFDAAGNIYITGVNGWARTANIWKYKPDGTPAPGWPVTGSDNTGNASVVLDSTGSVYTAGTSGVYPNTNTYDGIIHKFNSDGTPAGAPFPITYGLNGSLDSLYGIAIDSADNFIVSGYLTVNTTVDHLDSLVQKYSSNGTLLWQQQYDGIGLMDNARNIVVDSNDNIFIVGTTNRGTNDSAGKNYDWLMLKYSPDGTLLWEQTWDGGNKKNSVGYDLVLDDQDNLFVVGTQENRNDMRRAYVQYRDGLTGDLLKIQEVRHLETQLNHPTTEHANQISVALKDGKLLVSGYIWDTSVTNTTDYYRGGFVIAYDQTFVVSPSSTTNGTIFPADPVEDIEYNTTTAFTLTPAAHYHPVTPTGTCPAGTLTDNGDGTWAYTTGAITADCTVIANFAIDTVTLTYTAGANGSITGSTSQTVAYDTSGTAVTAVAAIGYHFVDWSDGSTDNPRTDANVIADITVTANFAIDTFTLTYTAGANGSITGTSPQVVNYDSDGTAVTAVPNPHYHFVDWSDGSIDNPRTDTNITAGLSVTANFAIDTFTLTYTAGANGSITGTSPQVINYNENGTAVSAIPASGYHFVEWNDHLIANPRTDNNVTGNISVTAVFAINTYTVNSSVSGGHGTINPAGNIPVNHGVHQQYTLTPAPGYHPNEITGTCRGTLTGNTVITNAITADCTVIVSFTNQFTLSLLFAGNGSGTVTLTTMTAPETCTSDCSYDYLHDTEITLSAIADEKNIFTGWSGDGCSGTDDCQITMDQVRDITATFKKDFSWPLFLPAITGRSQQ